MFGVQAVKAYQAVEACTDSPWRLIDRLYEGAIRRIDEGRLDKASLIVSEGLIGGLNPAIPFSQGLLNTYDGVLMHLEPTGDAATARQMLVSLREAWTAIRPPHS
jgi:flagellin-specific chaperone FliS